MSIAELKNCSTSAAISFDYTLGDLGTAKPDLNIGGLVCEIIFTALGMFVLPAFFTALHHVKANGTSFLSGPLVALTEIGNSNFFTNFGFVSSTVF